MLYCQENRTGRLENLKEAWCHLELNNAKGETGVWNSEGQEWKLQIQVGVQECATVGKGSIYNDTNKNKENHR